MFADLDVALGLHPKCKRSFSDRSVDDRICVLDVTTEGGQNVCTLDNSHMTHITGIKMFLLEKRHILKIMKTVLLKEAYVYTIQLHILI